MRKIYPVMTDKRKKWLATLVEEGPKNRWKSRTGYDCMQLGWTEWDYRRDGKPISAEEALEASRAGMIDFTMDAERITPLGLAALKEAGYDRKDI